MSLFIFNHTAPPTIYTLSLHDALPIYQPRRDHRPVAQERRPRAARRHEAAAELDRKSTRLNSSHLGISYAVFCLKKKTNNYLTSVIKHLEKHKVDSRLTDLCGHRNANV